MYTRAQLRAVDRLAVDRYGLASLVLMENAGRGCADVLERLGIGGRVVIACGRGNNGGDGLVLARHLLVRGYDSRVLLWSAPESLAGDAAANYRVLERLGYPLVHLDAAAQRALVGELDGADWIVDGLLGTGSRGDPRAPWDQVIGELNRHAARKLAVDLPSGLDADTGQPAAPTFRADHTVTLAAAKTGFSNPAAAPYLGQLHLADIGLPPQVFDDALRQAGPDDR